MLFLKQLYFGLLGLNLLALLVSFKHIKKRHTLFIPIILFAILTQVTAEVVSRSGVSHYFLFHIYIPVEYLFLSIYYSFLFSSKFSRLLLISTNIILIGFCIIYYYTTPLFREPDYTHFVISSCFISVCVILYFISLFKSEEDINLLRNTDFWINTGNLFFYAGCVFVMGLHYSLQQQNPELAKNLLIINYYLNLLLYLFYLIAFTWAMKKTY